MFRAKSGEWVTRKPKCVLPDHWGLLRFFSPKHLNAKHLEHDPSPQTTCLHTPHVGCGPGCSLSPILSLGEAGVEAKLVGSLETGPVAMVQGTPGRRQTGCGVCSDSGCKLLVTPTVMLLCKENRGQTVSLFWGILKDEWIYWGYDLFLALSFASWLYSGDILFILPTLNKELLYIHTFPIGGLNSRPEYSFWGWCLTLDLP